MNRANTILELSNQKFDLLVIGGGITGAGVALDAAARGMSVALVEKGDFASGTSSKSTKLIHGGLRYLKQFEIALVREVGQERALIHQLAPHLVIPEKMLLPLIEGGTFGKWATAIGLFAYDLLAGVSGKDRFKMLNKKEALAIEPLLPPDRTLGAGLYAEYRTDDARLTIEVMKTAKEHGAVPINYILAEKLTYEDGKVSGVTCSDTLTQKGFSIQARSVVNATGPWSDDLRKLDKSLTNKKMYLTKGVHLVIRKSKFPIQHAIYFDVEDKRMVFAIPRHDKVYIGTTDTPYKGDLDNIPVETQDINYVLNATNKMFPNVFLKESDVLSSWAGVRPLIFEEGKSASEISRKDEIFESESGLLTIAGGKLTGYRVMAQKIVDVVRKRLNKNYGLSFESCTTKTIPLTKNPFKNYAAVLTYQKELEAILEKKNIDKKMAAYLVQNYGQQTDSILKMMKQDGENGLLEAEQEFTKKYEWVVKPNDFWERRTGRSLFLPETVQG